MNRKIIAYVAQELMDNNTNCCLNCTHFKIVWDKENSVIPKTTAQYKDLRAKCTNTRAIHEISHRENSVRLQSLLNRDQIPVARKDCEYFELG